MTMSLCNANMLIQKSGVNMVSTDNEALSAGSIKRSKLSSPAQSALQSAVDLSGLLLPAQVQAPPCQSAIGQSGDWTPPLNSTTASHFCHSLFSMQQATHLHPLTPPCLKSSGVKKVHLLCHHQRLDSMQGGFSLSKANLIRLMLMKDKLILYICLMLMESNRQSHNVLSCQMFYLIHL